MRPRRLYHRPDPFTAEINRRLPELVAADVVIAVLPNGSEMVTKGSVIWADRVPTIRLNAPDKEAAAVLRDALADDMNRAEEGHG